MAGLTAEQAYGLSQSEIKKVASGFDHAERTGDNTFSIFFIDGSQVDLTIPLPSDGKDGENGKDGISIVDTRQTDNTHFVCVLSDGTETQEVQMPSGVSGSVEISKKANNQIKQETDGLFVAPTDVSGKVDKEDGKSLVSNTDIAQISTNKADLQLLMADDETTDSVRNLIKRAVEGTLHLTKEVIDHKPTVEEAKDEVLYLVPTDKEGVYKQYTKVGNLIVDLDNTEIDLSGYVQKDGDKVLSDNNYTDEDKAEVGKVKDKADLSVVESSQGRNLIPYPYITKSGSQFGITYSINDDGSISASGTCTEEFGIRVANFSRPITLEKGTYVISGCTSVYKCTETEDIFLPVTDMGSYFKLVLTETTKIGLRIDFSNGKTYNSTFYPMLEKGTVAHKYEPTTKSNVTLAKNTAKLQEEVNSINDSLGELKREKWYQQRIASNNVVNGAVDNNRRLLNEDGTLFSLANNANSTYKVTMVSRTGSSNTLYCSESVVDFSTGGVGISIMSKTDSVYPYLNVTAENNIITSITPANYTMNCHVTIEKLR